MTNEELKKLAAVKAAEFVEDGMIVGLGTGSTAALFIDEVGRRIREEGLKIKTVATSFATTMQAESLLIPVLNLSDIDHIDLLVDGVDEFDPELNGIKGGGGALLMEKIVASYAANYIWIADGSKQSDKLGKKFKLPVEVVPFGAENLFNKFEKLGYKPTWRLTDSGERFVTDMKHYIIDFHFEDGISDISALASELDTTVGIVEHGLFTGLCHKVILAGESGVEIFEK